MKLALKQAKKAYKRDEVPVGAVIVKDGKVISKAYNLREKTNLATGHAEILAIQKANKKLKSWRLDSCSLYVTIEPCQMCSGAIIRFLRLQVKINRQLSEYSSMKARRPA